MQKTFTVFPIKRGVKVAIFILFIFSSFYARAGNVVGAEIYAEKLSASELKVTLFTYTNCNNSSISSSKVLLTLPNGNSFYITTKVNSFIYTQLPFVEQINVTPLSPGKCNTCNSSNSSCMLFQTVIRTEYEGILDISKYTGCEFIFSWGKGNSRFTFSSDYGIYAETKINICTDKNISTPKFASAPFFHASKNECVSTFLTAFNKSDDSLVYSLVSPRTDSVTDYIYPSGYSYTQPFKYAGYPTVKDTFVTTDCKGFYLNPQTGELNFKATDVTWDITNYIALSYIAVKVTQYVPDASGTMKIASEVTRPMAVMIYDLYPKNPPQIVSPTIADTFICSDNELSLNFTTIDADIGDKTYLEAYFDMQSASFYQDTSRLRATGKFTWTPSSIDIRKTPHILLMNVYDKFGAFTRTHQKIYNIYVVSQAPEIAIQYSQKACGNYTFSPKGDTDQVTKYQWFINNEPFSTKKEPTYTFLKNGTYITKLLATNKAKCVTEIYGDTLIVNTLPDLDLGKDFETCIGEKITLNPFADNKNTYHWQSDSTLKNDTAASQLVTIQASHTYIVTAKNALGCTVTDTLNIYVKDFSVSADNDTAICYGNTINLIAKSDENVKYSWSPSAGITDFTNDTLIIRPTKTTTYIVAAKNALGCMRTDSVKVIVSISKADAGSDVSICKGTGTNLHGNGGYTYAWLNINGDTLSKSQDIYVDPLTTTDYYLHVDDSLHCQHSIDKVVVNVSTLPLEIMKDTTICQGDSVLLWADGGDTYNWFPGNTLSHTNTKTTIAFPLETTTYTVQIQDTLKACSDSRTVTINVNKDCVWPGDVNKDGIVDYKDVLEIGVGYGSTGYYRENGTRNWKSALVKDWSKSTYNNINYKHLDCNGDGYIDAADNFVISDNYGKSHASTFVNKAAETSQDSIYFKFDKDTFYAGDMVTANLFLGSKSNPFNNAYGVAYQYNYTDKNNNSKSVTFKPVCEAICGANDFILQSLHNYPNTKTGEIAQVRTDLKNVSAKGKLATFSYILEDSTHIYSPNGEWIFLKLLQTKFIDYQGKEYALKAVNDSAFVLRSKTQQVGIEQSKSIVSQLHIFPNPANSLITIESNNNMTGEIYITNALGKIVEKVNMNNQRIKTIDVKHFSAGIYMVQLISGNNIRTQKLVIYK